MYDIILKNRDRNYVWNKLYGGIGPLVRLSRKYVARLPIIGNTKGGIDHSRL